MKQYCTLFFLSLFALRGWAQKPASAEMPASGAGTTSAVAAMPAGDNLGQAVIKAKCTTRHVSLPSRRRAADNPTYFRNIRVLDYRRDTSRVGVVHSGTYSQAQIAVWRGSTSTTFAAYLDSVYASRRGFDSLLVVIKDLWISDSVDRTAPSRGLFSDPYWSRIAFRFEAYQRRDGGFVPLTYLDTLSETKGSEDPYVADRRLVELCDVFMEKVADIENQGIIARRRTVTMAQIDSFAERRFDYAMDTAVRLVTGVYASVDEFRDNRPSITDYKITKDKQGNMELRIRDADGQYYYSHTLWGFCEGGQTYVMMDGNLFPIFRVQQQFYVLGSDEYKRDVVAIIPFLIPLGSAALLYGAATVNSPIYRKLQIFRLDAESGKVTK